MNNSIDIPVNKLNEPGNIWIRPQNKQFRYSVDANEPASWLNPLPVYIASKEIKFGQPVSIASYSQEHSISTNGAREKTIIPTNSFESASFVGVAIEYGKANDKVHVQNNGELVYEISKKDNLKYWLPPYHENDAGKFVFDWTDSDVGSTVYISRDGYTLNVDDVSGGNIMSVGKLVFAPKSTEVNEKQQKIIIHIQAGGDDRGVKDTSQFTIQMSPSITPTSIESDYDKILFVKVNDDGLGEFIFNDESITEDLSVSPVGAIVIKSVEGVCDLRQVIGKKITIIRMGLVSGNFGFNAGNIGKIGLLNNGNIDFKSAEDYSIKVGIFKAINGDSQEFVIDCRFPVEAAKSSDKIGTIKPVFGPNDSPLLDIGYALVDDKIHRVVFRKNDDVDTSKINWADLIKNCYSKDIFEFGRQIDGAYRFSRVLEEIDGKTWSPDIYDTDTTYAIFNSNTVFKFRNLYYTIGNFTENNIQQVACQIKFSQDSLNTNEECIWPEESYKIKLKAESNADDYVLGGKGSNSTLFCNISRLVTVGNYMDGDGANIETYDITVKVKSTGQILSPGFYQNENGKWCGYEWYMYSNNGISYLYMSTIPAGKEASDCNGICITTAGQKMQVSDPEETLIVTVRRRPTLYNAVYLNQYPVDNPWTPYIDGNTGNLITENAIYFGSPSKMLSQNQTDDDATSGLEFNEAGRNGKIELTTENSGRTINLSTQVRGATNAPIFKDKKQVIRSDGTIANTIEWEYDFSNMVTSLNSYFAPILISKKSSTNDITFSKLNYTDGNDVIQTSDYDEYLHGNNLSAIEILDSFVFRNIKYNDDSNNTRPIISIVTDDEEADNNKFIFSELENSLSSNKYFIDKNGLSRYKEDLIVNEKYINYMSFLSLIGIASKDLYNKTLRLERIIHGEDFNKNVETSSSFEDNDLEYINSIGLLRESGYLKKSLVLVDTQNIESLVLGQALLPNNRYMSIVDRFVIDNFYDYYSLDDLKDNYEDYRDKDFNERLNLIQNTTSQRGSNLAQWMITYHDLGMSNYTYKVYDFFKYLKADNSYDVSDRNINEGSFIEADKIIFKKNTQGYKSLCKDYVGYKLNNVKTDAIETKEVYEISDEDFNSSETYYECTGSRTYTKANNVTANTYQKNKYYIKKTVDAKYTGYPFRWPLYEDASFDEIDFEYNFFSKKTFGLDDSATIYDNNEDGTLSSFSPQSLEGITFDTISKLSFLYSCFDKNNHTFESKMTWLSPFIVDDYSSQYKFEIKRLSQTKSIEAANDKIYSAFITKDNKISELGSLYYDAHKHILYESNAIEDTADTLTEYNNKYGIPNWQGYLLRDKQKSTGLRTDKNTITVKFDLGHNGEYILNINENEETYKKIIFLMTQGKLTRIKNLLNSDPYNANKIYGDFFKKDYLFSIDISTAQGVNTAKDSIAKYVHIDLTEANLNLLAKFALSPMESGPVADYIHLGSYGTLISEIKSLRPVNDITLSDIVALMRLVNSYQVPLAGNKDDINGDNAYKAILRISRDLSTVDSYGVSTFEENPSWEEIRTARREYTENCSHGTSSKWEEYTQYAIYATQSKFTKYICDFNSTKYVRATAGCNTHIRDGQEIANNHKVMPLLSTGIPDTEDVSKGDFFVDVEPTAFAIQEVNAFKLPTSRYFLNYMTLAAYFGAHYDENYFDYHYPERMNETIFYARCKYLIDLGYSLSDILSYMNDIFGVDSNENTDTILWSNYSLIDYARAAAYGSKNIVFYNAGTYKEFNRLPSSLAIEEPKKSIQEGILSSRGSIESYNNNPPLKVVWPSDINTFGQEQESLTSARNNLNRYIDRKISDETNDSGDFGIINIKSNPVTRISNIEESVLPDITIAELKLFLSGDQTICSRVGIDAGTIKDYNIDLTDIISATNNLVVPIINLSNNVLYTLFQLREQQYNQIFNQNGSNTPATTVAVCNLPKVVIIYDLVAQGLTFEAAKYYANNILLEGENITGGFTAHPSLEHTYGLLNISYFGEPIFVNGAYHGSRLEGLSLHNYTMSQKNINDFKLKELYDYNNIDRMIMAQDSPAYERWLTAINTIRNYIELFFEHSDKLLKDVSVLTRREVTLTRGTTYIDDKLDEEKVKSALENLQDSINPTISKDLPEKRNLDAEDTFSEKFKDLIDTITSSTLNISGTVYGCTKKLRIANEEGTDSDDSEDENETGEIIDKYELVAEDLPINFSAKNIVFENETITRQMIEFEAALRQTIYNYVHDYMTKAEFTIVKNPLNIEIGSLITPKAYNLEKYKEEYNRANSTGLQSEEFIYKDLLPEYGYLYNKPADGISIQKHVNSYEVNNRSFHNDVRTVVKHLPVKGRPIQQETFIGDKIEIREGAYLRGEQLPLPLVSLDIRPDTQNQSQRLSYTPSYYEYNNNTQQASVDNNITAKYVKITGVFPIIQVNGIKYSIKKIKKIILEGGVFNSMPNGLKIIPSIGVEVNAAYTDVNEVVSEDNDPTRLFQVVNTEFDGRKIYRNFIYDIQIDTIEGQSDEWLLTNWADVDVTLNKSVLNNHIRDNEKSIKFIDISEVQDSGNSRQITFDENFMRDIIINSNLFIAHKSMINDSIPNKLSVIKDFGATDNITRDVLDYINNNETMVRHISETNFELIY
jgi:hypothetical protein